MCDMPNAAEQAYVWDGNMEILDKCLEKREKNEAGTDFSGGIVFSLEKVPEIMGIYGESSGCIPLFEVLQQEKKFKSGYYGNSRKLSGYLPGRGAVKRLFRPSWRNWDRRRVRIIPCMYSRLSHISTGTLDQIFSPDIAEAVGISEGHLRRLFKQELNIKVVDYLMEFRLESAKLLMKNTDENLTEIWSKTGFTSAQYFSYVFKKRKEGMLPKECLKKTRNE
ncbi:MAG: helix-turn-helix transcriptional regulator [Blautia sp.]